MLNKIPEARPGSLEMVQDASIAWRHWAQIGTSLEDVLRPDYWRNVEKEAGQQRIRGNHAWNKIEVLAIDGSWEAELRVLSAKDGLVHTRLLRQWPEPNAEPQRKQKPPRGYTVEPIEGNGWRALDRHGDVVAEKLTTEDEAVVAAIAHAKKVKVESNG